MSARRVYSDAYGETTEGLRRALKGCNVPPALYGDLLDYFGPNADAAMARFVRSQGRNGLDYTGPRSVRALRPDRSTGRVA